MNFRFLKKTSFLLSSFLFISSFSTFAESPKFAMTQIVIAPYCFIENSNLPFKKLAQSENYVLIQAKSSDLELAREENSKKLCRFFKDVTFDWYSDLKNNKKNSTNALKKYSNLFLTNEILAINQHNLDSQLNPASFDIKYPNEVKTILESYMPQRMWSDLTTLTSFPNRYANSDNGVKAATWFKTQAELIANNAARKDVTVQLIKTGLFYKQPSVVVTVPGTDPKLEGVLLGGHMDTLDGTRPGADDDGTGAVTVLESMRTLLSSRVKFKRTMYFAWYAAEEEGLIGSQFVTKYFVSKKIPLVGALQLDMTGYQETPQNRIWIVDDFVDASLSKFVSDLAINYAKVEVSHTRCGYACSDHASWTEKGYRSAIPFEAEFGNDSPYIHTEEDKMDHVSLDHMNRYAIIGISFMSELAEPLSNN